MSGRIRVASRNRSKRVGKAEPEHVPTFEQMSAFEVVDIVDKGQNGQSIEIGRAYRRRRMIEQLASQGMFTDEEARALRHYRHHADLIERSPMRDSLCLQRGGGNGPTITYLNAAFLVRQIEAAVGALVDIMRAIIVEDVSLSQWAIRRAGALEIRRQRKDSVVISLEPKQRAFAIAKLEIKFVAQRVASELRA